MLDGKAFGEEMVAVVKDYVGRATAPLLARIDVLERQLADQPTPRDGKDADPEHIKALIAEAVSAIPAPEPAKEIDPQVIRDIAREEIAAMAPEPSELEPIKGLEPEDVRAIVAEAIQSLPEPRDGKDADPEHIKALVTEAVAALPAPADGKSVTLEDVAPLVSEAVQKAVDTLPVPKDGIGCAGAVIDRSGALIMTMTDGSQRDLGLVVGKDGRDGVDGKNGLPGERGPAGFSLDDFDTELKDGGRTLLLKFSQGEVVEVHEMGLDVMLYRGVFKDGTAYQRGDTVTWAGSLWHCEAPTTDKPMEGAKTWVLCAKRGRDGKEGPQGAPGKDGARGAPGRDGARSF